MVILLEILNSTQPELIPRREVSKEESWDNREKPLTKPERAPAGAPSSPPPSLPAERRPSGVLHVRSAKPDSDANTNEPGRSPDACVEIPEEIRQDLEKIARPGYRNPAFLEEYRGGSGHLQLLSKAPDKLPDDGFRCHVTEGPGVRPTTLNMSKILPKHLVQSSTALSAAGPGGGVFDSKESADSGISKGSMAPQSSTEDSAPATGSDGNSQYMYNQSELMAGRSQLNATIRRQIYHQESVKNRTNPDVNVNQNTPGAENRTAQMSPMVIVHRSNSDGGSLMGVVQSPGSLPDSPCVIIHTNSENSITAEGPGQPTRDEHIFVQVDEEGNVKTYDQVNNNQLGDHDDKLPTDSKSTTNYAYLHGANSAERPVQLQRNVHPQLVGPSVRGVKRQNEWLPKASQLNSLTRQGRELDTSDSDCSSMEVTHF